MNVRSPLVAMGCLGAGLMTGLSRFPDPRVGALVLLLLAWHLRRAPVGLLAWVGMAGLLLAAVARQVDAGSCAARLPTGNLTLTLRVTEPVTAGRGRGAPLRATCHGAVDLLLRDTAPVAAGTTLQVTGRWTPRVSRLRPAAGLLVVSRHEATGTSPLTPPERLRNAVVRTSARLYGPRAPIVDALILGGRGAMAPELKEDFARSGLVHLLSISGFHVGLITSWTILVALACGMRRQAAYVLGATLSLGYVACLGWPPPATRAAALGVIIALGVVRQRAVRAPAILVATCLVVMLLDPWAVFDLGAWLSAGSIAGLAAATRWSDRALGSGWGWRMLSSSVGSTLATAPLTAAVIGAVAPIGIVMNFAAIPLAALAVPGVAASLMTAGLLPPVAEALAAGSGLALAALEVVARIGASVPGGHLVLEPGWRSGLPWLVLLVLAGWGIAGRSTAPVAIQRWGWAAVGAIWLLAAADATRLAADSHDGLTLHFLDVGQGDAVAIRTPAGRWILVDAGPADDRMDAGRRVVAPFLLRQGARRLDAALVSHAHADHVGGLPAVLDRVQANLVLEPGMPAPDASYSRFLEWTSLHGQPWRPARRGDRLELDGVSLVVLHPDTAWSWWGLDLNENSLVVRVEWGRFAALLTGDAGFPAESLLAGRLGRVDLLKVGHHGSRGSTSEQLLAETTPGVAVISAGRRNRHGHPAPAALARLADAGARIFRTDRDGTIRVTVTADAMTVRGASGAVTLPLRP